MPRRNNRKRLKREGTLGFNQEKYIDKVSYGHKISYGHGTKLDICFIERADRPYYDRHKAHSYTRKTRRAMNEIRQMNKTTDKVCLEARKPAVSVPPSTPVAHVPAPATLVPAIPCNPVTEGETTSFHNKQIIIGGIIEWLKRKARLV